MAAAGQGGVPIATPQQGGAVAVASSPIQTPEALSGAVPRKGQALSPLTQQAQGVLSPQASPPTHTMQPQPSSSRKGAL